MTTIADSSARPGSFRSGLAAWITIVAGCAWMLTGGFGVLSEDEKVPEQTPVVRQVSAQVDAAVQMVVAMQDWTGADAMGAGLSSLEPIRKQGTLDGLVYVIVARWMGDAPASKDALGELVATNGDDELVRAVEACLAQGDARVGDGGMEASSLPPGVTRESLAPLGASATLLESMATGDAALGAQVAERASRIAVALFGFFAIAGLAFMGGVATLIVLGVRALDGRPMSRLAPTLLGNQAIHVELFAAWVVYEVVLGVVASRLDLEGLGTIGVIAFQALGLLALLWPAMRGMPWGELRRELGLTMGAGVIREVGWGVLAWCMAVPMVVVGALISLALSMLLGGELSSASHPLQEGLRSSSGGGIVVWFLIAAVVAPVLEEIVFRGGLYRGLRGGTSRLPLPVSMVISALASSLIFAAIHPQGVLFVPILGALAMSFCLVRELRGSLVAPMVGHGLNNGLIVTLNLMLIS